MRTTWLWLSELLRFNRLYKATATYTRTSSTRHWTACGLKLWKLIALSLTKTHTCNTSQKHIPAIVSIWSIHSRARNFVNVSISRLRIHLRTCILIRAAQRYLTACFGGVHPEVTRVQHAIACVLQRQGHNDEALLFFKQIVRFIWISVYFYAWEMQDSPLA